jgi:hypothetical protein
VNIAIKNIFPSQINTPVKNIVHRDVSGTKEYSERKN